MRRHRISLLLIIGLAYAVMLARLPAQFTTSRGGAQLAAPGGATQRFYYDPPNERQIRTELFSTDATNLPDSGGKILLKNLTVHQYPVTGGKPQLTAEAPECVYDHKKEELSSEGPLKVHAQDGRLFLEGTGFLLRQTNSSLIISNGVHSIFQFQSGANSAAAGTDISARLGNFLMKTDTNDGSAIYQNNVVVTDPKMKLTCEFLSIDLPRQTSGQTNPISHAVAETNVVIDFTGDKGGQTRATGQKAVYHQVIAAATNEIIELTDHARVDLTNGWMTADKFVLNRTARKLQGLGHVHFHYLAEGVALKTKIPAQSGTEIFCDTFDYDLDTRQADFTGDVHLDDEKVKITSGLLTTVLPKTEPGKAAQLDQVRMETNVVIDFQETGSSPKIHATGQRAVRDFYAAAEATNETVTLTGNPALQLSAPEGWMTADTITLDRALGRIKGVGNQHSVFKQRHGQPAALDTEIFSDEFDFSMATGVSIYGGNVRQYDPEMNATGKTLTIKIAKAGPKQTNYVEKAQLDDNAAIDFLDKPFSADDITNLPAVVKRLRQPADHDGVARFIAPQLTNTAPLLADYPAGTNAPLHDVPLQRALANDLNRIVRSGAVYEAGRFGGVYFSPDTAARMREQPLGVDLIELNRLLLLDAFQGQITRNPNGDKIHATGDHAILSQNFTATTTNSLVELRGHPRLERPNGFITATDAILIDRMTGALRTVGNTRLETRQEGTGTGKSPGAPKKKKETK